MERHNLHTIKKMRTPSVSIIVPVYNAETYLLRCIKSILTQTFPDWELLLIDDGSPDRSGLICDEIQNQYPSLNIRVFHKSNGGVASAREIGIKHALGEYSIHIDPDDWIDSSTLEVLYNKAKTANADMVICDFLLEYGSHTEILRQEVESSEAFLKQLFSQERHGSLCNKLIRTELYHKYNLHFPSELICWEDLYICCNLLILHQCRIAYVPNAFYHYDYFSNPNSMVRKASIKTLKAMQFFCSYFDNMLPEDKRTWLYETKGIVLVTGYRCHLMTSEEIRKLYPEINNWYIKKYIHDYPHIIYCSVAQILNGGNMKEVFLFQKCNELYQRIFNKIKKALLQ